MSTKTLLKLYIEGETATEADVLAGAEGKLVTADVIAPLLGVAVPDAVVEAAVEQYFIDNPTSGDVTGPASSTNDRIAVFAGTSGKTIKQGPVLGDGALLDIGTGANTLAAGDDPRFGFSSKAAVESQNIPDGVTTIRTMGYYAPGDGGGATYAFVEDMPPHPGRIQTVDGKWWEYADPVANARAFGAKGDYSANDLPAISDAISVAHARGTNKVYAPAGVYGLDTGGLPLIEENGATTGFSGVVIPYSNIEFYGDGIGRTIIRPLPGKPRHIVSICAGVNNFHIHDMELYGLFETDATGVNGLRLNSPSVGTLVERVYSHHNGGYGSGVAYSANYESRAEYLKYVDCEFAYNNEGADIHRGGHVSYVNCVSHHNVQGGYDGRGADLIYAFCRAYRNGGDGFGIGPISLNWPESRAQLVGCFSYDNGRGLRIRDSAESFPNIDPITTTGAANAYSVTSSPTISSLTLGAQTTVIFNTPNTTTAPTINVSGLGAKAILEDDGTAPVVGRFSSGRPFNLIYRPTEAGGSGAWMIVNAPDSQIVVTGLQAWGNTSEGVAIVAGRGRIDLVGCILTRNRTYGLSLAQQSGNGYFDPQNLTVAVTGGRIASNALEQVINLSLDCNLVISGGAECIQRNADENVRWECNGDLTVADSRIVGGTIGVRIRGRTPPTTTGTSTAYVLNHTSAQGVIPQLNARQRVGLIFNTANGAAPTLNVDGLGAKKLLNFGAAALAGGEFGTTAYYFFDYDPAADAGNGAWVRRRPPFFTLSGNDIQGQTSSCINSGTQAEGVIAGGAIASLGIILLSDSGRVVLSNSTDISRITGTKITDPSGVMVRDYGDVLYGQATYNAPALAAGASTSTTVTVTGAVLGDFVDAVSFSVDTLGVAVTAAVTATNTVTIMLKNDTAGSLDIANAIVRVRVKQKL